LCIDVSDLSIKNDSLPVLLSNDAKGFLWREFLLTVVVIGINGEVEEVAKIIHDWTGNAQVLECA
jgi:hypothetical protein